MSAENAVSTCANHVKNEVTSFEVCRIPKFYRKVIQQKVGFHTTGAGEEAEKIKKTSGDRIEQSVTGITESLWSVGFGEKISQHVLSPKVTHNNKFLGNKVADKMVSGVDMA